MYLLEHYSTWSLTLHMLQSSFKKFFTYLWTFTNLHQHIIKYKLHCQVILFFRYDFIWNFLHYKNNQNLGLHFIAQSIIGEKNKHSRQLGSTVGRFVKNYPQQNIVRRYIYWIFVHVFKKWSFVGALENSENWDCGTNSDGSIQPNLLGKKTYFTKY